MSNDDKNGRPTDDGGAAAERARLEARASDVGARIEAAKKRGAKSKAENISQGEAMGRGLKISAELIGGVIVGGGLGYLLDHWLKTFPLLFIVFFLLGSAAGMMGIIRQAQRQKTPPAPSVADDDEDDK